MSCWGCYPSSDCWGCWESNSQGETMLGEDMLNKIKTKDGFQNIFECKQSIQNTGNNIGNSDMSSPFITQKRIESMRSLLDLLEDYNNQLKIIMEIEE